MGWGKNNERSLTSYHHRQNRLTLGIRGGQWEIKPNLKTLPPTPPFFWGSTSLLISSPTTPSAVQGDGECGLWSVHYTLPLLLLSPQGASSPQTSSTWVLPMGCSTWTAPEWVPSTRCNPPGPSDLSVCRDVALIHSLLSPLAAAEKQLFALVKHIIPEALPALQMDLVQLDLGASWHWFILDGGEASRSFSQKPAL